MAEKQTMELAGTRLAYRLSGTGERRVALLHGWGCSMEMMAAVEAALVPHMRVLAVDFPPFGDSGRPPEPWGVPEYAGALRQLLERLDFLPCAAVAHSFGGRLALWLAAEDPALFTRLVLTGAAGLRAPQSEESRQRQEAFQRKKALLGRLKGLPLVGGAARAAEKKLRRAYGSADYNALDEEMRKTFVRVISQDLSECLPKIQQPTLLLWGDRDTETPLWMGQRMEREIPDAALIVLAGGTHFAYLEQSARFNTIVTQFLTGG